MILLLTSVALAGELPVMTVHWRSGHGRVVVHPPAGEHLAEAAPASGWLSIDEHRWDFQTDGASLEQGLGVALPGRDLHTLTGEMSLSFCEDEGTTCRWVDLSFWGMSQGRRGTASLSVMPRAEAETTPLLDPSPDIDGAFAEATSSNKLLLLDFSATWCPPCNLMAAQLLHNPDQSWALEPFVVLELDADRAASWELKDRYNVQGYPTLVAVRADGTLVDRLEGYPGLESTLSWMNDLRDSIPLSELAADTEIQGVDAAAAALRLAQSGEAEAARALLERAEDNIDAHHARIVLEPSEEDAIWLLEHAPDTLPQWIWRLYGLESVTTELKQALLSKLPAAILSAEPVDAADFAEWAAAWAEPVQQQILLALMTRVVESALTGEPDEDRGLYSTLADLYERTGDPDRAMDVLWDGVTNYPEEFTWHHALAGHLFHQGDLDSALDSAESAVTYSYGDNRLRAVERQALILIQLGRADEARSLAQTTLETQPAPREGLEVRTWRYRESLQEIAASGEAE